MAKSGSISFYLDTDPYQRYGLNPYRYPTKKYCINTEDCQTSTYRFSSRLGQELSCGHIQRSLDHTEADGRGNLFEPLPGPAGQLEAVLGAVTIEDDSLRGLDDRLQPLTVLQQGRTGNHLEEDVRVEVFGG